MNRYTYALFAFFLISLPVVGQIPGAVMVGPSHSKEEVAKAQQIVSDSQPANYQWNVGDFQIFQKGEKAKGALLWQVSDESIVTIKDIPPNPLPNVDSMIGGKSVITETIKPKDKYSRYLCNVYLPDGRCLNQLLLDNGLAQPWDGQGEKP